MIKIQQFHNDLPSRLPETHALLIQANLCIHPAVERVVLHGSRGLAGSYRPDSDIDLSLLVDTRRLPPGSDLGDFLADVIHTSLAQWRGTIELDTAAIFDTRDCCLRCFDQTAYDEQLCSKEGPDCFGIYKTQKGFDGFVRGFGLQVKQMYPCLVIWRLV
jgi:hypothetical protein